MAKSAPFGVQEQERLLRVIGEATRELCAAAIGMPRKSLLKAGGETVVSNIDELAFLLTRYRKYYQEKPHSTSWTTPATPPPNDPE